MGKTQSIGLLFGRFVFPIIYTCLVLYVAQEPVIYVAGRPHVLRLVDKPLENVE